MPNLQTNQSISDYNEKAQKFVQELKAFLHIEHKSNPKFNNRHLGKFLCPVVDFHHFTERKTWAERISLFGFPVVKNDDSMLTCIIFDDVNRLQPVINTRVTIHGKKPTADEVTHAFQEVQKFLASKAVTNRVCQGPNFIRVQTTAMASTVTTFLSTNQKLRGFKFERHGEDIFMSVSAEVGKVDAPITGAQNGTTTVPDPNEDFIKRVVTEIFGANIYATDYNDSGELIIGFDSAEAQKMGELCNEYGLDCTHKVQTLIFQRKKEYPFSYEDIKECYSKKSTEVTPAANNEPEKEISETEFYEQVRQFTKHHGGSLRNPKGGCTRISGPYIYNMDIVGINLDLFIQKALAEKPNWKIEKGRSKGGWLKFSLIDKPVKEEQPIKEAKVAEEVLSPATQPSSEEANLVTIAVRMPLQSVLMQIPDDLLAKEFETRGLQPVVSDDDVRKEFEKRGLKPKISDADLAKEFKERGLKPEISDDELKKMVKERGPVFAGALLQTLLEK